MVHILDIRQGVCYNTNMKENEGYANNAKYSFNSSMINALYPSPEDTFLLKEKRETYFNLFYDIVDFCIEREYLDGLDMVFLQSYLINHRQEFSPAEIGRPMDDSEVFSIAQVIESLKLGYVEFIETDLGKHYKELLSGVSGEE